MAVVERMVDLARCVQNLNPFQPGLGRALYVGGAKPATCSTPAPPAGATVIPFNFVSRYCKRIYRLGVRLAQLGRETSAFKGLPSSHAQERASLTSVLYQSAC